MVHELELAFYTGEIRKHLPVIEGVDWYVSMSESPGRKHSIYLGATFEVDLVKDRKAMDEVTRKIHQILSWGQIPLELETR
jgi:hypothetical protein